LLKYASFFDFPNVLRQNLVIWRSFVWLFGAILFGCLAQFCLVVWRNSVWLFGAILFGYLAQFCLVICF
jgi:hypothetical protein